MKNLTDNIYIKEKKPVLLILFVLLFFTLLSVVITVSLMGMLLGGL